MAGQFLDTAKSCETADRFCLLSERKRDFLSVKEPVSELQNCCIECSYNASASSRFTCLLQTAGVR